MKQRMSQIISEDDLDLLQRAARARKVVTRTMEREPCSICGRLVWTNEDVVKCLYCEAMGR